MGQKHLGKTKLWRSHRVSKGACLKKSGRSSKTPGKKSALPFEGIVALASNGIFPAIEKPMCVAVAKAPNALRASRDDGNTLTLFILGWPGALNRSKKTLGALSPEGWHVQKNKIQPWDNPECVRV